MTTPGQYAQELSQRASGPHDDQATAQVAELTAEAIRYLCYAAAHGGMTEPVTVYVVTGELSAAVYRLPQFLTRVSEWLIAEISAGRIAGSRPAPCTARPPATPPRWPPRWVAPTTSPAHCAPVPPRRTLPAEPRGHAPPCCLRKARELGRAAPSVSCEHRVYRPRQSRSPARYRSNP